MVDIFGTLGPACDDEQTLSEMLLAGMTGIRLNLSHITLESASEQIERLHRASAMTGIACKLLIDLQGPELRIGSLSEPIVLTDGETFSVRERIPVPQVVLNQLSAGQQILLDDGKLLLQMVDDSTAQVLRGGNLSSRKSVAIPGADLSLPPLTEQDLTNLSKAASYGVTGVMQPFVRSKEDLQIVRSAMNDLGGNAIRLYAKIENEEGVDCLPDLLPYADEFVIARGDLGNAVSLIHLPAVQKRISMACAKAGKPFMVVTQMLASMEFNPVPTRAEVNDVFRAVLDGASSVMVTGETAVGKYPVETIHVLASCTRQGELFLAEAGT